jgi:hypothetical protein
MASTSDRHARTMVPIPDRPAPALTTYDARDPDTAFPPIEPDVGYESGTTVGADYTAAGGRFTGRINRVQLDVGTDDHDHIIDPEERLRIAMARH